jgi:hypothetical protein
MNDRLRHLPAIAFQECRPGDRARGCHPGYSGGVYVRFRVGEIATRAKSPQDTAPPFAGFAGVKQRHGCGGLVLCIFHQVDFQNRFRNTVPNYFKEASWRLHLLPKF